MHMRLEHDSREKTPLPGTTARVAPTMVRTEGAKLCHSRGNPRGRPGGDLDRDRATIAMPRLVSLSFVLLLFLLGLSACAPGTGLFGGGDWQETGLAHEHIRSLEVDPNNSQALYAGDEQGGVFTSTDSGSHWTQSSVGLPSPVFVHALSFDSTGKKLYAATDNGVYVSADGGHHWSAAGKIGNSSGDLPADTYTALAFDVSAPRTIYVGTMQHGVLISTNDGTTWTSIHTGLPANDAINGLTFDSDTHQLWAATALGIYRSDDKGATWRAFNTGLPAHLSINTIQTADVAGGASGLVYAGTNHGFFLSHDSGAHWASSQESLQGTSISTIVVDFRSTNATTIYIGTPLGAFRSDDGGENWGGIAAGLPRGQAVYTLLIAGINNTQLYAAANAVYIFPGTSSGLSLTHLLPLLLIAALFFLLYMLTSRSRRRTMLHSNRRFEPEEDEEREEGEPEAEAPTATPASPNAPTSAEEPREGT
jgi:photosystem II stability/assembly factor-like uncharacterized protein